MRDGVAQPAEELLGFCRKRRSAGDERPKLPAEPAVEATESPGAAEEMLAMRFGEGGGKPTLPIARFDFAQETVAQGVQHPWNGDQRCGPLALYRANDLSRIGRALEDDGGAEKRRYHQSHELPENVAERHQRDKPQRVKPPFPSAVWLDAALEWLKIRQEIAMRKDDPARFRRRPRCEEDFGHGVASEGVVASGAALVF